MSPTDPPVRDAATVVLIRRDGGGPRVLMGQRGRSAAFMPSKFVFPGGAVDAEDAAVPLATPPAADLVRSLGADGTGGAALLAAAVRELWEETGLALAVPAASPWTAVDPSWQRFAAAGHAPATEALGYFFRAITPPGRPRRFDARFFLADAAAIAGDAGDFSGAEAELSHLSWLTLGEARRLDLPFVTELVLAEVAARLADPSPRPIPFFRHQGGRSYIDPA